MREFRGFTIRPIIMARSSSLSITCNNHRHKYMAQMTHSKINVWLTKNTNGLLIGSSIGCLYNEEISAKKQMRNKAKGW